MTKSIKTGLRRHAAARLVPLFAVFLINSTAYADTEQGMVQPISTYGSSYGEWAARWWEWALSIPAAENPVLDQSGAYCGARQLANVWFLAGNFGGSTSRSCTIPRGKPIFFPILNNIGFDPKGNETILDLRRLAANGLDGAVLTCSLDDQPCVSGQSLHEYRAQSPIFKAIVRTASLVAPKIYDPIVADGYWLLIGPLEAGTHTLHFSGANGLGTFSTDVTYSLTVE